VELSGLIFVALALVWAVVLIPKALRHHDVVAMTRAVDDVSDGVRVVARRLAPQPVQPVDETPATPVAPAASRRVSAAKVAARRRRRIFAVLLLADLAVGAAAALGVLLPWAPAIPVVLTVAFLVVARISVRRARTRRSRSGAAQHLEPTPVPTQAVMPEVEAPESSPLDVHPAEAAPRAEPAPAVISGLDETSAIAILGPVLEDSTGPETAPTGSVWDPLPVTLPTYVTKARAARSVRTIDLGSPGVSSSGHDAAASALVAEAATSSSSPAGSDEGSRAVGS
jgi:hypothetical protein